MSRNSFLAELRRRNVLRAGALYAGAAWALAQGTAQLFPVFGVPDWVVRWLIAAAVIGFPFFLIFSWFYEFTPEGLKLESDIHPDESIAHHTGKKMDRGIIAILLLAVVLLLANQLVFRKDPDKPAGAPALSIAVLPLANESDNKDEQFFSDGLSEDLITALSQFSGLKVISRNSAFQFRDSKDDSRTIGERLGVANLLEGSVRRSGDQVRINAALVRAADGAMLWSRRYDRPYRDLFALQDEITAAVAGALKARLLAGGSVVVQSDRPPGGNLDAYNAYLQGNFLVGRNSEKDLREAIDYYSKAIRLDPSYAAAQAQLAIAWTVLAGQFLNGDEQQQANGSASAAAASALALNPDLALAHTAQGIVLRNIGFNRAGAEVEFRRALQLAPHDAAATFQLGMLRATLGHLDDGVILIRRALLSDPLHATWYNWLAIDLTALGRLDEAEQAIRKAIELQPSAVNFHVQWTMVEIARGDAAAALQVAGREPDAEWREIAEAMALQIGPDLAAADKALKALIDDQADAAAYQIAQVYALRNDPDEMFTWLEHAWDQRDPGLSNVLMDPLLLRYKGDPRFGTFCRKLGLPLPDASGSGLRKTGIGAGSATSERRKVFMQAPLNSTYTSLATITVAGLQFQLTGMPLQA